MRRHRAGWLLAVVGLVVCAATGPSLPLRRSSQAIEQSFLAETPIGSPFSEVIRKLSDRGYKPVPSELGFYRQELGESPRTVGVSSIKVQLGDYWVVPFVTTSVDAFWGFDSDGRLIEVWVWKTTDCL